MTLWRIDVTAGRRASARAMSLRWSPFSTTAGRALGSSRSLGQVGRKDLLGHSGSNPSGRIVGLRFQAIFPETMPRYQLFLWNQHSRIKYPKSFSLPDAEAAREVALKVVRVFTEAVPYWNNLSPNQQNDFAVEIVNEAGQTVLTIPFRDAGEPRRKPS
jgi:hypothetical protein